MELFNSKNFCDKDIDYLQFSDEFNIEVSSKIKIVLGPNGIGKTSIYKNIKNRHPEYGYIDYNEIKNSIILGKDRFLIAPSILEIEAKEKEKDNLINSINVKKIVSESFKIVNKEKSDVISKNFNNYRSKPNEAIKKFTGNKIDSFINLSEESKELLINFGGKIFNIVDEEIELSKIKDTYKKRYLEMIEKSLNEDEKECPVCGSIFDKPIKEIIQEKLQNINEISNQIVKEYVLKNPNLAVEQIEEKLNNLKQVIIEDKLNVSDLEDYLICGGSKENSKLIISVKNNVSIIDEKIKQLEKKKEIFYNNIKDIKERVVEIFKNQLETSAEDIVFNEEKRELEIKLSRSSEKYSTGEINLITFTITLLEFIGSDKKVLIIDDPLSSYDIPNQYKIMNEITATNNEKNHILLFTHNIDCINIANSQNKGYYEYEIMDKINGELYINKINQKLENNGFSIDYILKNINNYQYKKYLLLLSRKDDHNFEEKYQKIFHYDYSVNIEIDGEKYSNDDLVEIIQKISRKDIKNIDSLGNSANKIIYLASLRVWIEKKFVENTNDLAGLNAQKELGNKIIFMFDNNHWIGTKKVTKSYLMSKKVMLNQNEHPKSQKEPFYFALSLSTEEIIKEILDIKEHFEN